ncbi:MAG TPA: hypothetical protein VKZ18_25760 [Polyangia bacterium]|nr:hypothetical protein [Polyangia bacterium]
MSRADGDVGDGARRGARREAARALDEEERIAGDRDGVDGPGDW